MTDTDSTARAEATTPLGEALEQAVDGISMCCRDVANLIQTDVDRMASGQYQLADLLTAGVRLLRVGIGNVVRMAGVWSDNLALLTAETAASAGAPTYTTDVAVQLPTESAGTITSSSLTGARTGSRVPQPRIGVYPASFTEDDARDVDVEVTVVGGGLPKDVYEGTLSMAVGGSVVDSVAYAIPIDEAE